MIRKFSLFVFSASLVVFTSCVSKRKYMDMERGRTRAEELSRRLSEENNAKGARINALIADFESMKNELLENNSIKDNYIDSLNSEIFLLTENLNKQRASLEQTSFNLDFEKQRLTNALAVKDRNIQSLQARIETLETEVSDKNSLIDQKNFDIGKLEDLVTVLQGKVEAGGKNLSGLQADLEKIRAEIRKLQAEIKEKDATITRLENNVKLLKQEIGG